MQTDSFPPAATWGDFCDFLRQLLQALGDLLPSVAGFSILLNPETTATTGAAVVHPYYHPSRTLAPP